MKPIVSFLKIMAGLSLALPITLVANSGESHGNPKESLEKLVAGNARYVSDKPIHANQNSDRRTETAKGQKPWVTILGCSDSRVPLERVFDAGVGEIFVVRVAGNVADTDEIGSIEYGTEHLGTPLLLVLGHSACGAVTAVAKHAEVGGSIPKLVSKIGPAVARVAKQNGSDPTPAMIDKSIRENVNESIAQILRRSPIVAELVKNDKLKIVGGYYDLASGKVEFLGSHPNESALLKEAHGEGGGMSMAPFTLALILAAFFLVVFYLGISEHRLMKGLKVGGRILLALSAYTVAMMAAVIVLAPEYAEAGTFLHKVWPILPTALVGILFAVVYAVSTRLALRAFIAKIRT